MNLIAIKGRLTKSPELKTTKSGVSVCNITVAVDRAYSPDGDKQTDFFDCVFWRQDAEFVSKYFAKGKEIIVTGEMQSRKYEAQDGTRRTVWEIQNCHAEFCGGKSDNSAPAEPVSDFAVLNDSDDTLPF